MQRAIDAGVTVLLVLNSLSVVGFLAVALIDGNYEHTHPDTAWAHCFEAAKWAFLYLVLLATRQLKNTA